MLGTIESSLERKQVPVDLGRTSAALASRVGKALTLHGGLRLSDTKSSVFSANFSPIGSGGIKLELLKGNPKSIFTTLSVENENLELALSLTCDQMVEKILGIPGFFSGKISYLSSLSGHKEIFVSDALMSSARPQTSFSKITFNPSWSTKEMAFLQAIERSLTIFTFSLRIEKSLRLRITEAVT